MNLQYNIEVFCNLYLQYFQDASDRYLVESKLIFIYFLNLKNLQNDIFKKILKILTYLEVTYFHSIKIKGKKVK